MTYPNFIHSNTFFKPSVRTLLVIWFCLMGVVAQAQFNQFIFRNYSVRDGLSQNTVACIGQDKLGFMWFGTFNGLNRFDGYEFVHYKNQPGNPNSLSSSRCRYIITDSQGTLWVETVEGIFNRYNPDSDNFTRFKPSDAPGEVRELFAKQLFPESFAYKHHHFTFHDEEERVFTYKNTLTGEKTRDVVDFNNPNGIHDSYLISLFVDNNHCLWVGAFSTGLYKADLDRKAFGLFKFGNELPNAVGLNNIRSIWQDANRDLWLGTRDYGVIWLDSTYAIKRHFLRQYNATGALTHNDVRKIFRDSKKRLWICTKGGISLQEPGSSVFTNVYQGPEWDVKHFVYNVFEDDKGRIWFATFNGLAQWNETKRDIILYDADDGVEVHPTLRFVLQDIQGHFWVGSEVGGLSRLTPIGEKADGRIIFKTHTFLAINGANKSLSDNRVYSACLDQTGALWIGTGTGLNRYNHHTNQFEVVTVANGLVNDMIMGILADDDGHVWVSHKRGVSKVDIHNLSVTNFSTADGLLSEEFNEDAYFKNETTGEMFFAGANGLNRFFPAQIKPNQSPPLVVVTALNIDGRKIGIGDTVDRKVVLSKNIVLTKHLTLPYRIKSFSLSFAAIAFSGPENITFEYMLQGFDKQWIKAEPDIRRAFYTNIHPGEYQFLVKARNNDGVWSLEPVQLSIVIHPPFWQMLWFRLLVVGVFIMALGAFFYFRLYNLRRKNLLLEQRVVERTKAIAESNRQISEQMAQIIEQNRIISNKNEEITAQAEQLDSQKNHLQQAYEELDRYRNHLEVIVDERTRDLRQAKEKAEESDRLKTSFLSNLSHEIRTPLNAIMGFTAFLFDSAYSNHDKQDFKLLVDANCQSLIDLIEEMIDYAKIEADQIQLFIHRVKVTDLMQRFEQVYLLHRNLNDVGAVDDDRVKFDLTTEIGDVDMLLETDDKRLVQVMSYLISNAIKFTNRGAINVGCRVNDALGTVIFFVKDTGIGISRENLDVIFESFRKIEVSGGDVYRGVGLGLSIASRLIHLLGGIIQVYSTPGVGSEFSIELPLLFASESMPSTKVMAIPNLSGRTILIAEDNTANFLFLKGLLKKTGASVIHAQNGRQVLDLCDQNPDIALVLMDIKMPFVSGNEALKQLRQRGNRVPVVAQTAYAFQSDREHFDDKAFNGLLVKPVKQKPLFELLHQLLC
jgi:signal transduction histidine kinase/ligand-binding sensor domain-containing protein